ncbi:TPA: hypothetical protein DDZ10_02500 [Candidatus Uhrbacteria bacterium]|nr:MAG: hypothetical protein UY79_C0001G0014 [Parcubacteria group bacterium GW2011_GWA2_53_21]OGL71778.1 MAG: hypothetical protein A3D69_01870 [Candidatus Uhrbacteria bacterium RIFCSPHIGHO2_02_FULL_54_11]HBL39519.1 hypothetical protein [Candidatus Uhrbacteria bacterium]
MNRRGYRSTRSPSPLWVRTAVMILLLFFLFLAFMTIFRRGAAPELDPSVRTSDDIVAELTDASSPAVSPTYRETPRGIPESAMLTAVSSSSGSAVAKRVFENNFFTHTILANNLPTPDETHFHYQAWLIRPYPFDFFETSPLVHNADGSWGMIWVGDAGETYDEFVEILVTLESVNDFDENPSAEQVLKGRF